MSICLVAAVAKNGCIGKNGDIPWKIPGEQLLFKEITLGKVVLMGRKTWESIPEKFRPLNGRKNIVVTRQSNYPLPGGVEHFTDIESALNAHKSEHICVIGGAEIYRATIDKADTLSITKISDEIAGDTFFPTIDPTVWELVEQKAYPHFWFVTYRRRAK